MSKINENISLNNSEKELFDILLKAANMNGTTVRVAGGWVRDKLLGLNPDDIDIVVDNMSGIEFAKIVSNISGSKKEPIKIEENPEKTKNIETATANIPVSSGENISVDFAQARVEEYPDKNSRNPIVRPGTIEEDAMRRDLTINSLFYNIQTQEVEDFTGRGKEDLKNNILRVPREVDDPFSNMSPEKTFLEDPLRVFRVIRFAARYNGKISPRTYEAMTTPSVKIAIKTLAKERIGKEIEKTLGGPNPLYAMNLLKDSGILQEMIDEALIGTPFENKMERLDMSQNSSHHEFTVWAHTLNVLGQILDKYPDANPEKRATMTLAAMMHDLGKLFTDIHSPSKSNPNNTSYKGHDKESAEIAKYLLRNIKLDKYIDEVSKIVNNHMRIEEMIRTNPDSAKSLRKFIRKMTEEGIDWVDMFNLALADGYSKKKDISQETIEKYQIFKSKLDNAFSEMGTPPSKEKIRPTLNGFELMKLFNKKKGGPWIAEVNEYIFDIMDEYPNESKDKKWMSEKVLLNFPQYNDNIVEKESSIDENDLDENNEKKTSSCCPMHLFKKKKEKIENCNNKNNLTEAISIMNELRKEYGDDENVSHLIARELFNNLLKNPKNKQIELLQYVFSKAEKNFFDPILGAYTVGMLLLLKTKTKEKAIIEMSKRMSKMSPKLLSKIINSLPKDIFNKEIKNTICNSILIK